MAADDALADAARSRLEAQRKASEAATARASLAQSHASAIDELAHARAELRRLWVSGLRARAGLALRAGLAAAVFMGVAYIVSMPGGVPVPEARPIEGITLKLDYRLERGSR
jgi:hypothetical protein